MPQASMIDLPRFSFASLKNDPRHARRRHLFKYVAAVLGVCLVIGFGATIRVAYGAISGDSASSAPAAANAAVAAKADSPSASGEVAPYAEHARKAVEAAPMQKAERAAESLGAQKKTRGGRRTKR